MMIVEITETGENLVEETRATLSPEAEAVLRTIAKENDDTPARAIARAFDASARVVDREPETPRTAGDGMTPVLLRLERETLLRLEGLARLLVKASDRYGAAAGATGAILAMDAELQTLDATRETAAREAGRGTFASGRKL